MANILTLKNHKPQIASSVFIAPTAVVAGDVVVGEGSSIWYNAVIRGDTNYIVIGKNTNIQDNATLHVETDCPLDIGDNVVIGHNAIVHCRKVGNNCLIGMGACILNYTEIGDNCIIGAGAMVTQNKKIPANSMVYGSPAKVIRQLTTEEIASIQDDVQEYKKLAEIYKKSL